MSSAVADKTLHGPTTYPDGLHDHRFSGVAKGIRLYLLPLVAVAGGWALNGPVAVSQEALVRGEVELVIGAVLEGEPEYLFDDVQALARDQEGLIYVADGGSRTIRVFDHRGQHVVSIGGRGEGPGELDSPLLCSLTFDPDDQLWVNTGRSFEIFRVGSGDVEHLESFVVRDRTIALCGNPMFAGPTGITVPRRRSSHPEVMDEHVQVTKSGEVWGRVPNMDSVPDFGVWKWPVYVMTTGMGTHPGPITPPFAARVLVAHAPDGGFARVFSPVYDISVHGPDGTEKARVLSDRLGPLVTEEEMREGYARLEKIRDAFRLAGPPHELVEYEEYRIPERKPTINRMWYDDDGRLWVYFWPAEADSMDRAHVYDSEGVFLHEAEWPRGIEIWHGGLSGDVAVGLRRVEFDVQQVVRLRFVPRPAPSPRGEP